MTRINFSTFAKRTDKNTDPNDKNGLIRLLWIGELATQILGYLLAQDKWNMVTTTSRWWNNFNDQREAELHERDVPDNSDGEEQVFTYWNTLSIDFSRAKYVYVILTDKGLAVKYRNGDFKIFSYSSGVMSPDHHVFCIGASDGDPIVYTQDGVYESKTSVNTNAMKLVDLPYKSSSLWHYSSTIHNATRRKGHIFVIYTITHRTFLATTLCTGEDGIDGQDGPTTATGNGGTIWYISEITRRDITREYRNKDLEFKVHMYVTDDFTVYAAAIPKNGSLVVDMIVWRPDQLADVIRFETDDSSNRFEGISTHSATMIVGPQKGNSDQFPERVPITYYLDEERECFDDLQQRYRDYYYKYPELSSPITAFSKTQYGECAAREENCLIVSKLYARGYSTCSVDMKSSYPSTALTYAFVDNGFTYAVFSNEGNLFNTICVRKCNPEPEFKRLFREWARTSYMEDKDKFCACVHSTQEQTALEIKKWVERDGEPVIVLLNSFYIGEKIKELLGVLKTTEISDRVWKYIGKHGYVFQLRILLDYFKEVDESMALDRAEWVFQIALEHKRYDFVRDYTEKRCQPEFSLEQVYYRIRYKRSDEDVLQCMSQLYPFFERKGQ